MKLGDYLRENSMSQEAFGKRIGRTQGRVSQLVRGAWPSEEESQRICAETSERVTPNDWLDVVQTPETAGATA